jgi:hypothetical protein
VREEYKFGSCRCFGSPEAKPVARIQLNGKKQVRPQTGTLQYPGRASSENGESSSVSNIERASALCKNDAGAAL